MEDSSQSYRDELSKHCLTLIKLRHPTRRHILKEEEVDAITFAIRFISDAIKSLDTKGELN